jgi:hypothetical protein
MKIKLKTTALRSGISLQEVEERMNAFTFVQWIEIVLSQS